MNEGHCVEIKLCDDRNIYSVTLTTKMDFLVTGKLSRCCMLIPGLSRWHHIQGCVWVKQIITEVGYFSDSVFRCYYEILLNVII